MRTLLQKLMQIELRSAAGSKYKRDLLLTFVAAAIFSALSLLVYDSGFFGVLLALLYFWHRYVVLNVAKERNKTLSDVSEVERPKI